MEKWIEKAKDHPILIASIVGIVVLYFIWPSASGSNNGSSVAAQEAQAIADSATANSNLAIAADQVQVAGIQSGAATAINGQNTAAAVQVATLGASVTAGQTAAALAFGLNSNDDALSLGQTQLNAISASQTSAQDFIGKLESAGLSVPSSIATLGLTANNPNVTPYVLPWFNLYNAHGAGDGNGGGGSTAGGPAGGSSAGGSASGAGGSTGGPTGGNSTGAL